MPVELVALGTLEGVEIRRSPVGGVVWDRGTLLGLDGFEVAWALEVAASPPLAAAGRRLYAGFGEWLVCLDGRTGAEVWAVDCGAVVTAVAAHPGGVDAVAGGSVLGLDPHGRPAHAVSVPPGGRGILRVGAIRYLSTEAGIWRLVPGERPALLYGCASATLYDRRGALRVLAEGAPGTVLVEDDGMALVWPFADAGTHFIAPFGGVDWAVVPTKGRGGLWVVDHRVQTRWQAPLPGRATALAVAGNTVAVALDDGGPVLAVIHREVAQPLLLQVDGADALHADGDRVYLTYGGNTMIFFVREP